ncbi:hypothetical protein V8E36_009577 [Tilletia maclaganii]
MPTLFLWGALDPTPSSLALDDAADGKHFTLPTLDPPSLYAATLLRLLPSPTPIQVTLSPPSALLHRIVPRLEFGDPNSRSYAARTDALEGIDPIEQYARTPSAAELRPSVDDAYTSDPQAAARAVALHALITHQLEPLTLHALFSHQDNFQTLALPTYSYTPHRRPPVSVLGKAGRTLAAPVQIRARLRAGVQAQLVRKGVWGLAGSAEEEREREERAKKGRRLGRDGGGQGEGPSRVRLDGKEGSSSIKRSSRKEMVIGWEKAKLTALAKQPLDVLNAALSSTNGSWLLDAAKPTSLDAHLFSALAPVLFPGRLLESNTLEKTLPLATLLRTDYPALVEHVTRLGQKVWAVQPQSTPSSSSTQPAWEWTRSGTVDITLPSGLSGDAGPDNSLSLGSVASYVGSSVIAAPGQAWSSIRSFFGAGQSRRHQQQHAHPQDPHSALRQEGLGWGRVIWITSAVVGFVSFIFISGLIQIEFVEEGEEAEHEGNEEQEGETGDDEREVDEEEVLLEEGEEEGHEHVEGGEADEGEEVGEGDMYIQDDFDDDDE